MHLQMKKALQNASQEKFTEISNSLLLSNMKLERDIQSIADNLGLHVQ